MFDLLFFGGEVLLETGLARAGVVVAVKDGKIAYVGPETPEVSSVRRVNLEGATLAPGFIEMHTHGAGGADFMDGTAEAFVKAARMHLAHGTTTLLPTSMASGDTDLFAFFDGFEAAKALSGPMPHMPGVHLEGPYFSPVQAGAQPPECMRQPFPEHAHRVFERARGSIRRWSCAPEVPGVLELGEELKRRGILAAIAHTDADLSLVEQAMSHGFTHLTHFYSGMSQLKRVRGRRVPGVVEAGYLHDGLTLEIIADGIHLPPALLRLIVKCKPLEKISLVTDSMRAAGMGNGNSVLGNLQGGHPVVVRDGVAWMPDGESFAGSVATADRLIRVMVRDAGLSLFDAVRLMTENPARLLGIFEETGSIERGKTADFVVLDGDMRVKRVYVAGEEYKEGKANEN